MTIGQITCLFLYVSASAVLFLVLLNRFLILIREKWYKTPSIILVFAVLCIGGMSAGYLLPLDPWALIPLMIHSGVIAGEAVRLRIRRKCAGSPPVDTIPHKMSLTRPVTTTDLVCHRYQIESTQWHGSSLRIVHLSDLHVHAYLGADYFREVLSAVEEEDPDLVIYTGDFVSNAKAIPLLKEVIRPVGRFGSYASLGNHDYWSDADAVGKVLVDKGIRLLVNKSEYIDCEGGRITLTGCDYPWGDGGKVIPAKEEGSLHLVMSHTPDNIYWMSKMAADCVFSGHCHAGQGRVPFFGSVIVPSAYGRRFDHGHFVVNGTHLFVAGGVGAANPPVRIYCQPDIFAIDIQSQSIET